MPILYALLDLLRGLLIGAAILTAGTVVLLALVIVRGLLGI